MRERWMRAWLYVAVLVAVPAEVRSAQQCQYNVDCDEGQTCLRGECTAIEDVLDYASADEACGADRRCRIERLKRRNRARRHAAKLEEEKYVEDLLERRRKQFVEQRPRLDNPWTVDYRISRLGAVGLVGGWGVDEHFRFEGQVVHWNASVSVQEDGASLDGSQPVTFIIPGVFYYFFDDPLSPFVGGSFLYARGKMNTFDFETPSGGRSLGTEYHALSFQTGGDLQVSGGAHVRFGFAYRPLIYNQARYRPGEYDEQARKLLEQWFREMVRIDVVVQAGWSF